MDDEDDSRKEDTNINIAKQNTGEPHVFWTTVKNQGFAVVCDYFCAIIIDRKCFKCFCDTNLENNTVHPYLV